MKVVRGVCAILKLITVILNLNRELACGWEIEQHLPCTSRKPAETWQLTY
jgi:hypothetical protein